MYRHSVVLMNQRFHLQLQHLVASMKHTLRITKILIRATGASLGVFVQHLMHAKAHAPCCSGVSLNFK